MDAYAWPTSVQQGDTVSIYISSTQPAVNVQIQRYGATVFPYAAYYNVPVTVQAVPDSAYLKGCDWTPALRIAIPDIWPSGVYAARITSADAPRYALFVVRQKHPGSMARMLFMLPLATMQAYNSWGGKSLYDFSSSGGVRSPMVSIRRPFESEFGLSNFPDWAMKFIQFMESRRYPMEYCTNLDIDRSPDLPMRYGVVVTAGHDEYWSRPMRTSLEAHVAGGGGLLIFGGNTCVWQIRIEGDDRIVCYKQSGTDPLTGVADSLVTVRWFDTPVLEPENRLTGASFWHGGYANFSGFYLASAGYGGFVVYNTNHWAFSGTSLSDGDTLGRSSAIVGYETDGALYNMIGQEPVVTGADGTPSNYVILGLAPGSNGAATMGLYEAPGLVFNACTIGWANGLAADTLVQRITLNVVDRALSTPLQRDPSNPLPPDSKIHVQPNPVRGPVSIWWIRKDRRAGVRVAIYDVNGAEWANPVVETTANGASARWDTRDRGGRPAPPGIYFARVEDGGIHGVSRFVVVR